MLRCRDVEQQASEYLDQELAPLLQLRFRMHLLICRNCRRYTQQLRLTVMSLKQLKPTSLSDMDDLVEKMRQQVSEEPTRR